jgi:4-diphosphocytidyl-2-C-methyl-D-erythritol kinase
MTTIAERARAKINLTLRVHGRRADGYHLLESLIAFADVADDVTFTPGATREVRMTGQYAASIAGNNLVDTAVNRIAAADPQARLGRVEVEKRLPIAAGIGGGSADAAAVLRAVRRANPAASIDWQAIAASLGADVTVCLADRASLVWGIGEHLEPAGKLPRLAAVLVCPLSASPFGKTKSVFGQLSLPQAAEAKPPAPLPAFAGTAALVDYMCTIGNDLRAPATPCCRTALRRKRRSQRCPTVSTSASPAPGRRATGFSPTRNALLKQPRNCVRAILAGGSLPPPSATDYSVRL